MMATNKKRPGKKKQFDTMLRIPIKKGMLDALREEADAGDTYPTVIVRRLIAEHQAQA